MYSSVVGDISFLLHLYLRHSEGGEKHRRPLPYRSWLRWRCLSAMFLLLLVFDWLAVFSLSLFSPPPHYSKVYIISRWAD